MELSPDRLSCKDVDECSITSGEFVVVAYYFLLTVNMQQF